MSDQDKPVFTIDEMSNDLRENEGLYEAEFKQMQEIADIQFGDGSQTIMDIEWLEGRTETERLVEIDRLDAVLNARGEKIDALMSAESARAEREAKHLERLAAMREMRDAGTRGLPPVSANPRGPMIDNGRRLNGPGAIPGSVARQAMATDPAAFYANFGRAKPKPMEFLLNELGGNFRNLANYDGKYASADGGMWLTGAEVDLRAIALGTGTGDLNNAAIQQQPTLYEGEAPIHLTDFVPVMSTSMTSLTWDDTTALASTLPTRENPGASADAADPTNASQTITVTRLPMVITLDNRLLMSPINAAEYSTSILNQTWGTIGSNEIAAGNGTSPNQRGIVNRANIGTNTFIRDSGNIYTNFVRAANQAQAARTTRGFMNGTLVCEPQLLYALLDYRESGRPVFNSDTWPIRKFGFPWYPTLGWGTTWSSAASINAGALMNFAGNSVNWVQGMNLKMVDQPKALQGQTDILFELYNMYQFRQAADIRILQSENA